MAVIVVPFLSVTSTGSGSEDSWSCSVFASPDSTLCFTLLLPAGHVEPVFRDGVFSAAVCCNNRELHNTEKKVVFATCTTPVPCYTRHDLLSLETAAAPPCFLSPQLIACLSHLGIVRNLPRKPHQSRRGGKNERRKIKVIVSFHDRHPSDFPALQPPVNTPLPYHLPLHLVTVTTSQPPRSALRCVPLTDSCFTFPIVLPQPKTHSLSACSMQDLSALPGGGPTYPLSTLTSCC